MKWLRDLQVTESLIEDTEFISSDNDKEDVRNRV